jgi:hypothetical protein
MNVYVQSAPYLSCMIPLRKCMLVWIKAEHYKLMGMVVQLVLVVLHQHR